MILLGTVLSVMFNFFFKTFSEEYLLLTVRLFFSSNNSMMVLFSTISFGLVLLHALTIKNIQNNIIILKLGFEISH